MAKKKGRWTEEDQMKAAERGQGAEIGAAHGSEGQDAENKPGAAHAGNKPGAPKKGK